MDALAGSNFLQALGWAVLNSLWQMALLWVAYQIINVSFKLSPVVKNRLAGLLLAGGFGWFILSFISLFQFNHAGTVLAFPGLRAYDPMEDFFQAFLPLASFLYLIFLIIPIGQLVRNYRYVRIIRKQGLQRAGAEWRLFVQKVSSRLGISQRVEIWLSDLVNSPVTIGHFKPIILLPVAAFSQLSPAQVEAILLHELSHIRRFDYLINLLVRVIQAILYFNPFVKAFARIMEIEREKCCDQMVIQFQYEPHSYASALLTLEREARGFQVLTIPAFRGRKSELLLRIEAILGRQNRAGFSAAKLAGTVFSLGFLLVFFGLVALSYPRQVQLVRGDFRSTVSPFLVYPLGEGETRPERPVSLYTGAIEHRAPGQEQPLRGRPDQFPEEEHEEENSAAIFAGYGNQHQVTPAETARTEEVKQAVEASKRVLEETKWKQIELNIADAMTLAEKEITRQALKQKAEEENWLGMENRLKMAYDQIDWTEINKNLSSAMLNIRYDSLQHVFDLAISNLDELKKQLSLTEIKGIPDTDVTITAVQKQQEALKKAITELKKLKARKILEL